MKEKNYILSDKYIKRNRILCNINIFSSLGLILFLLFTLYHVRDYFNYTIIICFFLVLLLLLLFIFIYRKASLEEHSTIYKAITDNRKEIHNQTPSPNGVPPSGEA